MASNSSLDAMISDYLMSMGNIRRVFLLLLCAVLQACGTLYATALNRDGQEVMLLGYDPVAYFVEGKPVRGTKAIQHSLENPSRTYYFASAENKQKFLSDSARYEPQYGAFCASGAAYRIKLGTDPTEFEIVNGRLFIFGDILGKEMWRLFRDEHIRYADQVWPEIRDQGWRRVSLSGYLSKVPWYRDGRNLEAEFKRQNPGKTLSYDPGGMITNLFLKRPGWRAAEGFGQPALGWPE
jgi:YHS domain-containing protein